MTVLRIISIRIQTVTVSLMRWNLQQILTLTVLRIILIRIRMVMESRMKKKQLRTATMTVCLIICSHSTQMATVLLTLLTSTMTTMVFRMPLKAIALLMDQRLRFDRTPMLTVLMIISIWTVTTTALQIMLKRSWQQVLSHRPDRRVQRHLLMKTETGWTITMMLTLWRERQQVPLLKD